MLFDTGHVGRTFKTLPEGSVCISDPLNGNSEGWPAVTPEVVDYLGERGIRCVGIDAPSVGGVDEKQALMTY